MAVRGDKPMACREGKAEAEAQENRAMKERQVAVMTSHKLIGESLITWSRSIKMRASVSDASSFQEDLLKMSDTGFIGRARIQKASILFFPTDFTFFPYHDPKP